MTSGHTESDEPTATPQGGAHDGPLTGRIVAAFRFDTRRALLRSFLLALPLMALGTVAATVGLRHLHLRSPARIFAGRATFQLADPGSASWQVLPWEQGLMAGGLLLILLSNLVLVLSLRRHLAVERFILLRVDGLVRQVDTVYTLVPWDEIEHVRYDATRAAVVLEMRAGGEVALADQYAGIRVDALAQLVRDVHRKAIWGLLGAP